MGRPSGASTDPDLIMIPEDYLEAVGLKNFGVELDTGDATAGGFDVMPFLREHRPTKFISLHLKDRKKDKSFGAVGRGGFAGSRRRCC